MVSFGYQRIGVGRGRLVAALCLVGLLAGCAGSPDDGYWFEDVVNRTQGDRTQEHWFIDSLFYGLQALDDGRLLEPEHDNAYMYFNRVLDEAPDNEVALKGMEDIVLRFVELARRQIRRGLYDDAEELLLNAEFVQAGHPAIAPAREELESERKSGNIFFEVDAEELLERSEVAVNLLHTIGRQIRDNEAFFLITAEDDETGRWMFMTMRDGVRGFRLRGSIEIDDRTGVLLRMPKQETVAADIVGPDLPDPPDHQ